MVSARILFGEEEALILEPGLLDGLNPPFIYSGQRLRGIIRLYHDEAQTETFDTMQILLEGQVSNTVTPGGRGWATTKPLIRMSCVKEKEDFQQITSNLPYNNYSQAYFFFDIPNYITLPSSHDLDSKVVSQLLPPSICMHKKRSEWSVGRPAGQCHVTYHIQARLLKNGETVCRGQRDIILLPVAEIPPPMNTEDLEAEYILSTTSTFGSFWKRKQRTVLFAYSAEPQPIVMHATLRKGLIPGTNLLFNFSARNIIDDRIDSSCSRPRFTTCEITLTLEATTYFQEREQKSVLSRVELQNSQVIVLKTTKFQPQTRKMRLEDWQDVGHVTSGSKHLTEWNTTKSVQALIPRDAPRLPSFSHPMISRRYAFDVRIRFGTDIGRSSRKAMRLKVPVQIVHAGLSKTWEGFPVDDCEEDVRVPAYVSHR